MMEFIVGDTLEKCPETTLTKYPILKVAYRDDGTRKDIKELLRDRAKMLERGEEESEVNSLLLTILESRETSKEEAIQQLNIVEEEIEEKEIEDGFEYELLKRILQRGKMSQEKANRYVGGVKGRQREDSAHVEDVER